ncbi:MAG TPA: hypothetical protein VK155_07545 [Bacteroidales bacterium]|jgi:hypothetical protein|nr:hypothetical protein [Bacteroidales bacterium]
MLKALRVAVFISLFVSFPFLSAQDLQENKPGMVKFTPDFRFKDGIFLNFEQVKENNPIPKAKLLTSVDYNDREFFRKLFENDKIYFYDNMGIRQEVGKNNIWGYARNGVLYVQIQENFNRITFVGSISHFVADITTYDSRYYNPYGYGNYYDPYYYSPYGYNSYYSPYSPYSPYYSPYRSNMSRNELKQYIIDFDNGKVLEFDIHNTELLLMKDNQLYEEWVNLPRRKRKELMFVYIRKFNEKNPLYIPSEK